METGATLNAGIPLGGVPGSCQAFGERRHVVPIESGMRLEGRRKIGLYPQVKLDVIQAKPGPAARLEARRLVDLGETEQADEVTAGRVLASGWNGELNVIDPFQRTSRSTVITFPISSTPLVNTIGS